MNSRLEISPEEIRILPMTMLEAAILTFVALIALSLGALMFQNKRDVARQKNCSGNLKSMGVAMLMYSGDFSGLFPPTLEGNSFEPLNAASYLNDSKVYECPGARSGRQKAANSDYWYVGGGLRDDNSTAASTRLAFDQFGNHGGDANKWMNVLFVDGHVEGGKPGDTLPFVNKDARPRND